MAKLGPIIGTITVSIGKTSLPAKVIEFEVPLRTTDTKCTDTSAAAVNVNRTELRRHLTRSVRLVADHIEADSSAPDVVTASGESDSEPTAALTPAELHENAKHAHHLDGVTNEHPKFGADTPDRPENPATSIGEATSQGDVSSLPDDLTGVARARARVEGYEMGSVVDATNVSVAAADHLDRDGKDAGAIAALLALARKIDDYDTVVDHIMEQIEMDSESKIRPPASDNVSLPTYLKYCESLGLTPGGRGELSSAKKLAASGPPDDLAAFRANAQQRIS